MRDGTTMYGASGIRPPAMYAPAIVSGASQGSPGVGLFQAQLEAHHEIDPGRMVLFKRLQDRLDVNGLQAVLAENLGDLFTLDVGRVTISVSSRCVSLT